MLLQKLVSSHTLPEMRVFLALLVGLSMAPPSCWTLTNITQLKPPKQPSKAIHGPLPCYDFYAYCHRPYNSSRPGMTRLEGDLVKTKNQHELSNDDFLDHRCFCDADCKKYGDCCLDAVTDMGIPRTLEEFENALMAEKEEPREWECHNFPAEEEAVYMIGSCPSTYTNVRMLNRCKRQVPHSEYGYSLDIPVMSQVTKLTYVNIYCALCNDDTDLFKWTIQIYCPPQYPNCKQAMSFWKYVPGERHWTFHPAVNNNITGDRKVLKVSYGIRDAGQNPGNYLVKLGLRKCRQDIIGSCPESWAGRKEDKLCRSYSLIVKSPSLQESSKLFKNEYCAICNGVPWKGLQCPKIIKMQPGVGNSPQKPNHSYAVLFDFIGQGSHVGEIGVCGIDQLVCGFGELCDQLHQRCLAYTCGRMYDMDDSTGKCILNRSSAKLLEDSDLPYLKSDCPKVYVTKDHFVRYRNLSVYIKAIHRTYNGSQYEVVNASTILICARLEIGVSWKFSEAQSILSKVCVSLSLISLVLHIAINIATPALLNLPGKNLLSLSIALFVAQLCFEFGIGATTSKELCVAIGLLIHFGFMAAFMWMNVMAIDVYRTFGSTAKMRSHGHRKSKLKFRIYSTYAWSSAFAIVLVAYLGDIYHWIPGYEPMYGDSLCWISNRHALLIYFALPLAVILVVNFILFTLSVMAICQTSQEVEFASKNSSVDDLNRTFLYVKLALIMGLTWIFGFVAALTNVEEIWYIFILFNCLQGAFIFVAFSCKKSVIRMMPDMPCRKGSKKSTFISKQNQRQSVPTLTTIISGKNGSSDTLASQNK